MLLCNKNILFNFFRHEEITIFVAKIQSIYLDLQTNQNIPLTS